MTKRRGVEVFGLSSPGIAGRPIGGKVMAVLVLALWAGFFDAVTLSAQTPDEITARELQAGRWHKESQGKRVSGYDVRISADRNRVEIVAGPPGQPLYRFKGTLSGRRLIGGARVWQSHPRQQWLRGTFEASLSTDGRRIELQAWLANWQAPFVEVYVKDN